MIETGAAPEAVSGAATPGATTPDAATPGAAATHVTFEAPGDFDLDVERRDWDDTYGPDLGT